MSGWSSSIWHFQAYPRILTSAVITGSEVVLGPPAPVCYMRLPSGCPIEQAIGRQRLRPGSGFLSVKVTTDGPTRVLQITDVKQKVYQHL
jgi:hypothetical protein